VIAVVDVQPGNIFLNTGDIAKFWVIEKHSDDNAYLIRRMTLEVEVKCPAELVQTVGFSYIRVERAQATILESSTGVPIVDGNGAESLSK
jgi:hypothetical protein